MSTKYNVPKRALQNILKAIYNPSDKKKDIEIRNRCQKILKNKQQCRLLASSSDGTFCTRHRASAANIKTIDNVFESWNLNDIRN